MTDTAKQLLQTGLYDDDDYEDDPIGDEPLPRGHEEYGLDDNYFDEKAPEEARMDQQEEERLFADLLFAVQGVGSIKNVNGYDVYVKHEHCEDSLKFILQNLRSDGQTYPLVKLYLGQWGLVKKDLIHLLVFHQQDKRLSFLTAMILVQLTEQPAELCKEKAKYIEYLREYKECFSQPNIISVLMGHLADCLKKEQRNEKHEQMIELIIVLFKQLLQIPDERKVIDQASHYSLQKRMLMVFLEESVLDAFIFMTQDFSHPFFKKISIHFLEIWYQIFKNFTPQQIFCFEESEKQAHADIEARERSKQKRLNFLRGIRHSKFGSQLQMFREDGSSVIISNIYQKNIEINDIKKGQRQRPRGRMIKDQKYIIEAPETQDLVNEAALEMSDKKFLSKLRETLEDMLKNSYCPLIEQIFVELDKNRDSLEDFDKFHYFKLSTFMMQVCRLQAYQKQKEEQAKLIKEAEAQQAEEDKKNLFNISKTQKPKRVQVPKAPLNIDISLIGASLQLNNFEYLFATLLGEIQKNKKRDLKIKDFHSALQLFTQFLYVIRDMASSQDEKNKKNAQILLSFVFSHDHMMRLARHAFLLYEETAHHKQFLHDIIEFTHIMVNMLDEYSKGKVLTITTNKLKKVKKSRKHQKKAKVYGDVDQGDIERVNALNEEDMDDDYNPSKPEDLEKDIDVIANQEDDDGFDDMENLSVDSDEEEEHQLVERKFNFLSELTKLVDYDVVRKYMIVIRDKDYKKNPQLLPAVTSMFKRFAQQLSCTWIFFQLEYLIQFEKLLSEGYTNNHLMKGIDLNGPVTAKDRQVQAYLNDFKTLVTLIVRQFLDTLQSNSLLGVECLFRFQTKEIKDDILSNYQSMGTVQSKIAEDEDEIFKAFEHEEEKEKEDKRDAMKDEIINKKNIWNQEQDTILIENFATFKDLGKKSCCEFLAELVTGKTPKEIYKRIKLLKLHKRDGGEKAKLISQMLNQKQSTSLSKAKVSVAVKKFLLAKLGQRVHMEQVELQKYLEYVIEIEKNFLEFKQSGEDILLYGTREEIEDLQRAQPDFTIVPISRDHFEMLNDQPFIELLGSLGISYQRKTGSFPKISGSVGQSHFSESIEVLFESFQNMRNHEGSFDKETLNNYQVSIQQDQAPDVDKDHANEGEEETSKKEKKKHKKSKKDKKRKKEKRKLKYNNGDVDMEEEDEHGPDNHPDEADSDDNEEVGDVESDQD